LLCEIGFEAPPQANAEKIANMSVLTGNTAVDRLPFSWRGNTGQGKSPGARFAVLLTHHNNIFRLPLK
jgi:hypothetical protein